MAGDEPLSAEDEAAAQALWGQMTDDLPGCLFPHHCIRRTTGRPERYCMHPKSGCPNQHGESDLSPVDDAHVNRIVDAIIARAREAMRLAEEAMMDIARKGLADRPHEGERG